MVKETCLREILRNYTLFKLILLPKTHPLRQFLVLFLILVL